jgi:hypothetical protein
MAVTAFSPRTAIVTAGDSGIGKATCVHLARGGLDIGLTYNRDEEGARDTAEEVRSLGRRAEIRHMDLTRLPEAAGVVDELAEALGSVDVFVNNAGTGSSSPFLELSWDDWRGDVAVDLDGAFLCLQRAARRMVAAGRGGRLIAITSVHEHVPKSGSSAYCAAKGGLGLLVKVAALELAEHGITVNAVAPGEISTPMTGQPDTDPRTEDRPAIPAGRPGSAHEIAAAVAFIASPAASYLTGHSMVVDGGLTLMSAEANQLVD